MSLAGRAAWGSGLTSSSPGSDRIGKSELRYLPDTMVTEVTLYHPGLQILLHCHDAVDFHENVYVKEVTVENMASRKREVRLFFSLDLGISGNDIGDTAGYDPKTEAVIHYKGARYLLASGLGTDSPGLSQYAVGQKGMAGKEGTFRDAEDGLLSGNPMAQGSVDSVIAVHLTVEPLSRGKAYFWIAAGSSWQRCGAPQFPGEAQASAAIAEADRGLLASVGPQGITAAPAIA